MSTDRFHWTPGDVIVKLPAAERRDYNPDEPRGPDGRWGDGEGHHRRTVEGGRRSIYRSKNGSGVSKHDRQHRC